MSTPSAADLVRALKDDDPQAWDRLVSTFGNRLRAFVRRGLPRRFRQRVDPEDIVQDVFASMVGLVRSDQLCCETDERLWHVLRARAAARLFGDLRAHRAARRDLRRHASNELTGDWPEPADRRASPDELAAVRDEMSTFIGTLHPRCQVVCYLRLEGYTLAEVAELMRCSERTMDRLWDEIGRCAATFAARQSGPNR